MSRPTLTFDAAALAGVLTVADVLDLEAYTGTSLGQLLASGEPASGRDEQALGWLAARVAGPVKPLRACSLGELDALADRAGGG